MISAVQVRTLIPVRVGERIALMGMRTGVAAEVVAVDEGNRQLVEVLPESLIANPDDWCCTSVLSIPKCTLEDVGMSIAGGSSPTLAKSLADYFAQFMPPIRTGKENMMMGVKCRCGEYLTGFLGTFVWGLAHGEGYCRACGHPGRALHILTDNGQPVGELHDTLLLYHPDGLRFRNAPPHPAVADFDHGPLERAK